MALRIPDARCKSENSHQGAPIGVHFITMPPTSVTSFVMRLFGLEKGGKGGRKSLRKLFRTSMSILRGYRSVLYVFVVLLVKRMQCGWLSPNLVRRSHDRSSPRSWGYPNLSSRVLAPSDQTAITVPRSRGGTKRNRIRKETDSSATLSIL